MQCSCGILENNQRHAQHMLLRTPAMHFTAARECRRSGRSFVIAAAGRAADRVKLGSSDLSVSECCLGTMTFGQQNTEAEAHQQLSYAVGEAGLNFIDTAEMYPVPPNADTQGSTDRYISSWMKGRNRDDIVLASKVSGYSEAQTYLRDSGETTRVTAAQIEESVNNSLQRLGTDHIDLLQVHWPDRYMTLFGYSMYDKNLYRPDYISFEEQLRGLENVVKAGKVRHVGVSNETSYGVCEFANAAKQHGLPKIVSIQNSYSLIYRGAFEADLAETCAPFHHNVGLLVYSPLAGGSLTGKYLSGNGTSRDRFTVFPGYMKRYNKSLARQATEEYRKVAEKHGHSLTQMALAFVRSRWFVSSTIIGATTMNQLKENIAAFDSDVSAECESDIQRVYRRLKDPAIREE